MYGYSLYLYFDFAGYSAFAVGVSYLLGIRTPENFNRPFLAAQHQGLLEPLAHQPLHLARDHVYMRFMLAAAKGRWFAGKYTASYLGFFLTFGLMGLWHGIEPYYLLYGLYHGTLLVGHDVFTRWNKPRRVWGDGPLWRAAGTWSRSTWSAWASSSSPGGSARRGNRPPRRRRPTLAGRFDPAGEWSGHSGSTTLLEGFFR